MAGFQQVFEVQDLSEIFLMCLVCLQSKVDVGQVSEGFQQNLGSDCGLEKGRVELVPEKDKRHSSGVTVQSWLSRRHRLATPGPRQIASLRPRWAILKQVDKMIASVCPLPGAWNLGTCEL